MATNRTFTMLKPDAVEKGHIGAILEKITASGFRIVAMKFTQMTTQDAKAFYDTWTNCSCYLRKR
jgi:nucleoside-diphosphate kinase